MYATTTQLDGMAAAAVARARYVGGVANGHVACLANGVATGLVTGASWSIPCTKPATFHKPRPRRSLETSS